MCESFALGGEVSMVAAGMQLLNMGNCDFRICDAWRSVLKVNIMWLGSKNDYPFETEKGQELLVNRHSTVHAGERRRLWIRTWEFKVITMKVITKNGGYLLEKN